MDWQIIRNILIIFQHIISFAGVLIILSGVMLVLFQYLVMVFNGQLGADNSGINNIRLRLGRVLILGLEFIVAADLIGTTTTPDYYAVGLLAIIVVIRTVLSFSINRELMSIPKEQ